jgi:predicted RNase H-like HicB family nuclease
MQNILVEDRWAAPAKTIRAERLWKTHNRTYICHVWLCPEDEGGFSVFALRLPGVASQGQTVEEALANIADAVKVSIEQYLEQFGSIPWSDVNADWIPANGVERQVIVNV